MYFIEVWWLIVKEQFWYNHSVLLVGCYPFFNLALYLRIILKVIFWHVWCEMLWKHVVEVWVWFWVMLMCEMLVKNLYQPLNIRFSICLSCGWCFLVLVYVCPSYGCLWCIWMCCAFQLLERNVCYCLCLQVNGSFACRAIKDSTVDINGFRACQPVSQQIHTRVTTYQRLNLVL